MEVRKARLIVRLQPPKLPSVLVIQAEFQAAPGFSPGFFTVVGLNMAIAVSSAVFPMSPSHKSTNAHRQKTAGLKYSPAAVVSVVSVIILLNLSVVILESLNLEVTLLGSLDAFSASLGSSHCRDVRNMLTDSVLTDVRVIV